MSLVCIATDAVSIDGCQYLTLWALHLPVVSIFLSLWLVLHESQVPESDRYRPRHYGHVSKKTRLGGYDI